jgi:hypothetical protein
LLNFLGLPCWSDNTGAPITVSANIYHPVGDGFYVMVAPLSTGSHAIHFHGTENGFTQDVTYNITVQP